jgi:hypothetical protein
MDRMFEVAVVDETPMVLEWNGRHYQPFAITTSVDDAETIVEGLMRRARDQAQPDPDHSGRTHRRVGDRATALRTARDMLEVWDR